MATDTRRGYHKFILGKSEFEVDVRYTNLRPIGRGAYGLVAAAEDMITGQKVAIKRISRVFTDLIDAKRILREIKLLRHLKRHDNIIEILDIMTGPPDVEDFHTLYIVTQLFECDLERIITSSQKLTDQHAQYFVYQILRGMRYIHSANVLHRDLKPSNLLVNSNCDLAICDFGLARGISTETIGDLTEYVVTRWYRAPELLCECPVYGTPVDVWSVGCIFAEILGRKPVYKGTSTRDQLELIIAKLGSPTPSDLAAVTSRHVLDAIRRMPAREPVPWASVFPDANPLALDLLSRMLVFDQAARITVAEALAHPYLAELHARASEPLCPSPFDFTFERGYPDEMPRELLQKHMYEDMIALRKEFALQYPAQIRAFAATLAQQAAAGPGAAAPGGGAAASATAGGGAGGAGLPLPIPMDGTAEASSGGAYGGGIAGGVSGGHGEGEDPMATEQ